MLLELEDEDIVDANYLVFVCKLEKADSGPPVLSACIEWSVLWFTASTTYLKNLLLISTALFSSVRQEPLIEGLCFSSNLTVIALWKLAQQNWISNNVASLLVDLQYFRF